MPVPGEDQSTAHPPTDAGRFGIPPLRFLLLLGAIYVALHAVYFLVPDQWLSRFVYHYGIVSPGALVISHIAPQEAIHGEGNRLWSARATLEIVRGCDGSGLLFLLAAAILAFPSTWRQKLAGLAGALLLIYLLNQLRIIGLYFVASHRDAWFVPLHSYFVPITLVMACVAYFAWWTSGRHGADGAG